MSTRARYKTFADFYPFYLSEHSNQVSRRLHFVGTSIALVLLIAALATQTGWLIAAAVVQGYAFAWVGHYFFEHNKPATFQYPGFSFMGDWRMWWDIVTGKIPL
ncbi:MAG: Mpo1-like protein [Burkholderiaceae bacterium]